MKRQYHAVFCAVLAAALYALNSPLSKLLLEDVQPAMMASLLYLGAGAGACFCLPQSEKVCALLRMKRA